MNIQSKLPNVGTTIFTVMSALAQEHQAINLSQGFPNFDCFWRCGAGTTILVLYSTKIKEGKEVNSEITKLKKVLVLPNLPKQAGQSRFEYDNCKALNQECSHTGGVCQLNSRRV